jgi:hypothetical protein
VLTQGNTNQVEDMISSDMINIEFDTKIELNFEGSKIQDILAIFKNKKKKNIKQNSFILRPRKSECGSTTSLNTYDSETSVSEEKISKDLDFIYGSSKTKPAIKCKV